jgi:hypothetical protein
MHLARDNPFASLDPSYPSEAGLFHFAVVAHPLSVAAAEQNQVLICGWSCRTAFNNEL